jgi:hypothetical protein
MPATYKKIASVTVGSGGSAEIDFQSIPGTYTDLVLNVSMREESTNTSVCYLKFNNSTSNITTRYLRGNGASASSGTETTMQFLTNSNLGTTSTFSNVTFYIPNYAGSTNKSAMSDTAVESNNASTPDTFLNMAAHLWSDTTAINRITVYLASGDIAQHSTATLYGILKK